MIGDGFLHLAGLLLRQRDACGFAFDLEGPTPRVWWTAGHASLAHRPERGELALQGGIAALVTGFAHAISIRISISFEQILLARSHIGIYT